MRHVRPFGFLIAAALNVTPLWVHPSLALDNDPNILILNRSSIECIDVIGRAHYAEEFQRQLGTMETPWPGIDQIFSIILKIDQAAQQTIDQRFSEGDTDSLVGFSVLREGKIRITVSTRKFVAGRTGTLTQGMSSQVLPIGGFLFFLAPGALTDVLRSEEELCEPSKSRTSLFEALDQQVEAQTQQALEIFRQRGDEKGQ